jgi:hypothetical protein
MGDRVNIVLKDGDERPAVVIYLHWGYTDRYVILASAINHAKPRWFDPSYCTRMIISDILKDKLMDETGQGIFAATMAEISTGYFYTNDYVVVDLANRTVDVDGTPVPFDVFTALALTSLP